MKKTLRKAIGYTILAIVPLTILTLLFIAVGKEYGYIVATFVYAATALIIGLIWLGADLID